MRKLITSVILISGCLMVGNVALSCDKVDELIDNISVPIPFTIPLDFNAEFPFATASTTETVTYPEIPVNIDVDAKIKEQYSNFSINNLKAAKLEKFSITAIEGNAVPLDAILDAEVFFKTPENGEIKVATVTGNTNPTVITFSPTNADLINHLKSKQNSFFLKIKGSKITAGLMKIKINTGFRVEVGL
ncbi:hypothetical protein PQ459_08615 [Chryseobacterium sp. KACC 21268]|nr:hypothetical protein PQ459_08615 [Chryseobacterium sp. KACC 21268]